MTERDVQRRQNRLLFLLAEEGVDARFAGRKIMVLASRNSKSAKSSAFAAILADELIGEGLAHRMVVDGEAHLAITAPGRMRVRRFQHQMNERRAAPDAEGLDAFRAQHDVVSRQRIEHESGASTAYFNEGESPLLWMRRRKGADGRPLIGAAAFAAGERLRQDYTLGQMAPRMTADWSNPLSGARKSGSPGMNATESMMAARQRVSKALDAVGPEFSGLLFDLCCFLKGLEAIEREHRWPVRSGKVVAHLALQRLARHYGFADEAAGPRSGTMRTWHDAGPRAEA